MKNSAVLALALAFGTAGCAKENVAKTEDPPPVPQVDRETLAVSGYYTSEEGEAAWAARQQRGVRGLDGSELVGKKLDRWYLSDWKNSQPLALADLRGQVVVVRFWTSPDCPFCAKTLPALQKLSQELAGKPVRFIGAYHAKPADQIPDYMATAATWGVTFPIGLDREWQTLRAWWLSTGPRNATSVTFVIGKDGAIRFVHPGPVFHPSSDPAEAKENADYLAVRQAILAALE